MFTDILATLQKVLFAILLKRLASALKHKKKKTHTQKKKTLLLQGFHLTFIMVGRNVSRRHIKILFSFLEAHVIRHFMQIISRVEFA